MKKIITNINLKSLIIKLLIIISIIFIAYSVINFHLICKFKNPILMTSKRQDINNKIYYGCGFKITKTFLESDYNEAVRDMEKQKGIYNIYYSYNISYVIGDIIIYHKIICDKSNNSEKNRLE